MGKITDELIALITKQLQDHGIVVWYDPEHAYGDVLNQLHLPETTVLRYQGSFFELRHRLEPWLEFVDEDGRVHANIETPPRVLLYVPLDRSNAQHALIEAEAAGVVMEPGGSPWQRNTRLKVLAERIFKGIAPDRVSAIAAEVEAGRRTLLSSIGWPTKPENGARSNSSSAPRPSPMWCWHSSALMPTTRRFLRSRRSRN